MIVNLGHARSREVSELAAEMARRVYDRFGERLVREVRLIGPRDPEADER